MPKVREVKTLILIFRSSLILFLLSLAACSGADFAGSSASSATDGNDQKNTEQPTDIAGGFGLACEPSELTEDPSVSAIGCKFADKSGNKFKDTATLKLIIIVSNGASSVDATMSAYEDPTSFRFTIAKTEASNVTILSKFTTPDNPGNVVLEKNYKLTDVLSIPINDTPGACTPTDIEKQSCAVANGSGEQSRTCSGTGSWGSFGTCTAISCDAGFNLKAGSCVAPPTWVDVTTTTSGAPSSCAANESRCTKKLSDSALLWSKVFPWGTHNGAEQNCDGLNHNGKSNWRLPTSDELLGMCSTGTWPFAMNDNSIAQQAFFHTKTPSWSVGMYFMIGFGTDPQGSSFCNGQGQASPNVWSSQLTMKHICVHD